MRINFSPIFNYKNNLQNKKNLQLASRSLGFDTYSFQGESKAIYAIKKDGSNEKFATVALASKTLEIKKQNIYSVLQRGSGQAGTYTFVWANDAEIEKPDGEKTIDNNVLISCLENFSNINNFEIYSIDFNGNLKKYNNMHELCEDIGCGLTTVSDILNERKLSTNGFVFAKANKIESRDESGKIILDKKGNPIVDQAKINKLRERFLYGGKSYPIVMISQDLITQ